jgi:hypothetical protein
MEQWNNGLNGILDNNLVLVVLIAMICLIISTFFLAQPFEDILI